MGSLDATGISVVSKTNVTIRNRAGRQIVKSDSATDVETTVVSSPPVHVFNSGSIVRDNNSVVYTSGIVNGLYFGSRSSSALKPSVPGTVRDLKVNLAGNKTVGVVPTALSGVIPEYDVKHAGQKVIVGNTIDDSRTRKSDAGAFQNF
jgi:hypothetical protein